MSQVGPLRDPRHELFAQFVAGGAPREEAYTKAGFTGKNPKQSAGAIARKPIVKARIRELLDNASRRSELSRKQILDRIFQDWELSRKLGQMSAALKAGEMMGKEMFKMFVERKEVGGPGDFANKSEEELREIIRNDMKDLGWDEDIIPPNKSLN